MSPYITRITFVLKGLILEMNMLNITTTTTTTYLLTYLRTYSMEQSPS